MFYPLVSVIIPVYQAEKFLTECVESVRKQDYSELEIVLVNDGSTDRSNQMCEELAAADPRIRVIHQNNKGSGAARNAGIKRSNRKISSLPGCRRQAGRFICHTFPCRTGRKRAGRYCDRNISQMEGEWRKSEMLQ